MEICSRLYRKGEHRWFPTKLIACIDLVLQLSRLLLMEFLLLARGNKKSQTLIVVCHSKMAGGLRKKYKKWVANLFEGTY